MMLLSQILAVVLLTGFAARSQTTNDHPDGSSTNAVPPALKALLQTMTASAPTNNSQPTNDKAGIYATTPLPSLKTLLPALAPTAKIIEGRAGDAANITCEWPDVSVRFTVKTNWNGPVECAGMKKWISKFPTEAQKTPGVAVLLRKMDASVGCIGSVITPGYDPAGKASSLVQGLAASLNGFIFSQQSFYDATGAKIIGVETAPSKLRDQKQRFSTKSPAS